MSVIVGISADSDFVLQNAGYRVLIEIACPLAGCEEDRRALEAGIWSHFLDLTILDREQARRIARLLDEATQIRVQDWRAEATEASLSGAAYYETFLAKLRLAFGEPPVQVSELAEPVQARPQ